MHSRFQVTEDDLLRGGVDRRRPRPHVRMLVTVPHGRNDCKNQLILFTFAMLASGSACPVFLHVERVCAYKKLRCGLECIFQVILTRLTGGVLARGLKQALIPGCPRLLLQHLNGLTEYQTLCPNSRMMLTLSSDPHDQRCTP